MPFLNNLQIHHIDVIDTVYNRILATFSCTFALYENLRSVELWSIKIDAHYRDMISSLSMLEDLTLSSCEILARDGAPMTLKVFSLKGVVPGWEVLPGTSAPLLIVDPGCICRLHIDDTLDSIALITGLGAAHLPHLVELSLRELFEPRLFLALLKQCPQLESLGINSVPEYRVASLPTNLPPNITPRLRRFTGPRDLVALFVSNRPVSAVTIVIRSDVARGTPQISVETFKLLVNGILRSSVPLLSLSLPRVLPSLDFLQTIATMFSELRELSLTILQPMQAPRQFRHHPRPQITLDTRKPELRDELEEAFNNLPDEDISDSEEYVPITVVEHRTHPEIEDTTSTQLRTVLNWIVWGRAAFPQLIEVLQFHVKEAQIIVQPRVVSPDDQHQVIAALTQQYPLLREVQIGYPSNTWKRDGMVWKSVDNSYIQVVNSPLQ
ncbi:hypothetical protein B0H11DRAFT_2397685 [Mycena galericulata]|nr:hypothetical protein B0H11DRAFT_2397685 [Mycena galericulata]